MTYRRAVSRVLFACLALLGGSVPAFAQASAVSPPTGLGAASQCVVLPTANMGTGVWEVSGTFSGTVSFTVSVSGDAASYQPVNVTPPNSTTQVTSATAAGSWTGPIAAYRFMRACMTSYTSGTATVLLSAAATGGGGGGAGGTFSGTVNGTLTSDPDDGSIAGAQTNSNVNGLNMAFDGSVWRRVTFGTAGTASAQVTTVQGIASMTPLLVNGSGFTQPISGAVSGSGNFTIVQPTGTNLHTVCDSGCSSSTAPADNSAFTAGTTSSSPMSGFYHASRDSLTDGRIGAVALTIKRAMFGTLETPLGVSAMDEAAGAVKTLLVTPAGVAYTQDTQATQDTALTPSTTTGAFLFGRASAAAPTDVTADNKAVLQWCLRSGACVFQPSYAGVLASTGNGTSGTGVPRIAIASDNSPIAGMGVGATGSAVPANANYVGGQDASGFTLGDIACTASKIYDASTSGNTELVAISGSKNTYICGYEFFSAGTVNVSLVAGTGTACASAASGTPSTGTSGASAALTPAFQFTAQTGKISAWPTHGYLIATGTANALCIKTSGAVAVQAQVFYQQR